MNDELEPFDEQRLRSALERIADAHEPARPAVDARPSNDGRRRWLAIAAAVALLVGAVVVVAAVNRSGGSEPNDPVQITPTPVTTVDEAPEPTGPPTTAERIESSTAVVDAPSVAYDVDGGVVAVFDPDAEDAPLTYFGAALADSLLNRSTILGGTMEARADALYRGGLTIHTTLDPSAQASAEIARNRLPSNETGIDAAIVVLDNETGAVRAMVGGANPTPDPNQPNMALTPRRTGSAASIFVLPAAFEAGARPDDAIDGTRGCVLPIDSDQTAAYGIFGGVAGFVGSLRESTARSIPCASNRLAHIVGLDTIVDTTYRMAASPYLAPDLDEAVREPIRPEGDIASGPNPMSPLDMASAVQTIAAEGLHHEPFFVTHIDGPDGERVHVHERAGTPVLDPAAALRSVEVFGEVLEYGTARNYPLADARPAFGKTGTVMDNTDAWFVGATPQYSTAVWVGDPVGETPMIAIPEFVAEGVSRVQGGIFPAAIWKTVMDAVHQDLPIENWDGPAPVDRQPVRLVLPGFECFADGSDVAPGSPGVVDGIGLPAVEVDAEIVVCPSVDREGLVDLEMERLQES